MKTKPQPIQTILLCLICFFFIIACGQEEMAPTDQQAKVFPNKLKATVVKKTHIPTYYEAVGTVKAKTSTTLSSKIPGHVNRITVVEGNAVANGDILIEIDDRGVQEKVKQAKAGYKGALKSLNEIEAAIDQAKAQKKQALSGLELAQTEFNRHQQLIKSQVISQQKFDQTKTQLEVSQAQLQAAQGGVLALQSKKDQVLASIEMAKAKVDEAQIMKSHTLIRAPFDGIIVNKHVDIGSLAVPGTPLLTIEQPHGFRLEVDVREEEFAGNVEVGRKVATQIDALGKTVIYGHVAEAVPTANALSRTFRVKIALPDIPGLKSGMYGKAMCSRGGRECILIPKSSLVQRGQLEQVFTVDKNSLARLRLVKTGKQVEDHIEVVAGIKIGDTVISNPPNDLIDRHQVDVEVSK